MKRIVLALLTSLALVPTCLAQDTPATAVDVPWGTTIKWHGQDVGKARWYRIQTPPVRSGRLTIGAAYPFPVASWWYTALDGSNKTFATHVHADPKGVVTSVNNAQVWLVVIHSWGVEYTLKTEEVLP